MTYSIQQHDYLIELVLAAFGCSLLVHKALVVSAKLLCGHLHFTLAVGQAYALNAVFIRSLTAERRPCIDRKVAVDDFLAVRVKRTDRTAHHHTEHYHRRCTVCLAKCDKISLRKFQLITSVCSFWSFRFGEREGFS